MSPARNGQSFDNLSNKHEQGNDQRCENSSIAAAATIVMLHGKLHGHLSLQNVLDRFVEDRPAA